MQFVEVTVDLVDITAKVLLNVAHIVSIREAAGRGSIIKTTAPALGSVQQITAAEAPAQLLDLIRSNRVR